MDYDEYFALEKLIHRRDPVAIAALLRSEKPLTQEARDRLAEWLEKKNNGRPRLLYLEREERDGAIIMTFQYFKKNLSYEDALGSVDVSSQPQKYRCKR